MPDLHEVLQHHRQKYPKSCAASGMEIICKCHGLIPLDDYRFQERFGDTNIGFEQAKLLNPLGIVAVERTLNILDCLDLLEIETNQGRFPLVSLPVAIERHHIHCHIFLCGKQNGQLALFDPADGHCEISSKADLENRMNKLFQLIPSRTDIGVLIYSMTKP
jgi:hypothetical protein